MSTPTLKRRPAPDPIDELDGEDLAFEFKCSVLAADRDTHGSAYDVEEITLEVVDRLDRLQRVEEQRNRVVELIEEWKMLSDDLTPTKKRYLKQKTDTLIDEIESNSESA